MQRLFTDSMLEQHIAKTELHHELKLCFNELKESHQAIKLLSIPFNSVRKVSTSIIKLMTTHKITVLKIIANTPEIITELHEPLFGCLYKKDDTPSPQEVWLDMIKSLSDNNTELDKIMQIHCVFSYRIYDLIENNAEKASLTHKLFAEKIFNENCRNKKNGNIKPIYTLGVTRNKVLAKKLPEHHTPHLRAFDVYTPNIHTFFITQAYKEATPVICGPSGHTRSLFLGAATYGQLSTAELTEYSQACFAFLTAGGNHSRHVVMHVANKITSLLNVNA